MEGSSLAVFKDNSGVGFVSKHLSLELNNCQKIKAPVAASLSRHSTVTPETLLQVWALLKGDS